LAARAGRNGGGNEARLAVPRQSTDCYDHAAHVWKPGRGLLRRTKQAIESHLAHLGRQRGIVLHRVPCGNGWGSELDVQPITLYATGTVTDLMVASYLAK
jgi:hypothetical protein